ncbi:hypothetical protein CYMTET_27451, partial [Cymbomonas tetramitiformis]
ELGHAEHDCRFASAWLGVTAAAPGSRSSSPKQKRARAAESVLEAGEASDPLHWRTPLEGSLLLARPKKRRALPSSWARMKSPVKLNVPAFPHASGTIASQPPIASPPPMASQPPMASARRPSQPPRPPPARQRAGTLARHQLLALSPAGRFKSLPCRHATSSCQLAAT